MFILIGTVLLLDIGVHCLVKKLLNRFTLSKKSVTSLLSTSSGGINGILLSMDAVFGLLSLSARRSLYFSLEKFTAFDLSSVRAFKDA